jgi:hypothetical protein
MNGLIAFFDILGYQSFLENNSATESAEKVLGFINDIPNTVKKNVSKAWLEAANQNRHMISNEIVDSFNHLIFSDTIVLSVKYPKNATESWKQNALCFLVSASGYLCGDMFNRGLPLRGAIVEGEFLVKDFCFAGKAIVEAYKLCESLNYSGIVCSHELQARAEMSVDGVLFHKVYVN